ncbi:MAG TPA: hypothetical protein VIV12_14740 [Streptosporangiaceae bacterium]
MSHLKVTTTSQGGHATVELDGMRMDGALLALGLRVRAGEPNSATLDLYAPTVEAEGEFEVVLPEQTQALLKRLGWTPPADARGDDA